MVSRVYDNIVEQKGRLRKDGSRKSTYYYRVRRKGAKPLWVRMQGRPGETEFENQFQKLLKPSGMDAASPFSFDVLIQSYRESSRYAELSKRSKQDYSAILDILGEWLGGLDASRYPRSEVIRMRDANQYRPRRANYLIAVTSVLMEHARDLDWRNDNPAKGVKKLKGGSYRPWTVVEIEKFRELATCMELLIFELALGTGQRPGDLTNIRWSDYDGHTIRVVQSKTGIELWIPPTDHLKRVLEEAKSVTQGLTILHNVNGQPFSYDTMEKQFRACRDRAGIKGASLHGLRKNATIELAEAGCSNAEIKSITGHTTDAMVNHYSKGVRQRKLAEKARKR